MMEPRETLVAVWRERLGDTATSSMTIKDHSKRHKPLKGHQRGSKASKDLKGLSKDLKGPIGNQRGDIEAKNF